MNRKHNAKASFKINSRRLILTDKIKYNVSFVRKVKRKTNIHFLLKVKKKKQLLFYIDGQKERESSIYIDGQKEGFLTINIKLIVKNKECIYIAKRKKCLHFLRFY